MAEQQQVPEHFIYAKETDLSKADALAWVMPDPNGTLTPYPFKFPELGNY